MIVGVKELLQLQNLLDGLGSETARSDFISGTNGAVVSGGGGVRGGVGCEWRGGSRSCYNYRTFWIGWAQRQQGLTSSTAPTGQW